MRVRFAPDGSGARAAKLRVSGAAAAFAAALGGTAVAAEPVQADGTSYASAGAAEPRPPARHRARYRFRRGKTLGATPLRDSLVAARRAVPRG